MSSPISPGESEITRLLRGLGAGDAGREAELFPLVYAELRALARSQVARERRAPLQATELVHEAWLRVAGGSASDWNSRAHFFGAAARAMRRILIEEARRRARLKRGGGEEPVELDELALASDLPGIPAQTDLLALEEALAKLEREDERKARIVELRTFAGLTVAETASALGLSVGTIKREWRFLRAWLREALGDT